ncbi:hypothetical protein ACFL5V_04935 [Fibrobacterota bacterium]
MEPNEENNGLPEKKIESLNQDGFLEIKISSKAFLRDEAKEFQLIVNEAMQRDVSRFLINFNDCQYVSSEGLGCIAEFWRKCSEKENITMVSVFSDKPVNELLDFFKIIGLARVMKEHIFTDYNKAREFLLQK